MKTIFNLLLITAFFSCEKRVESDIVEVQKTVFKLNLDSHFELEDIHPNHYRENFEVEKMDSAGIVRFVYKYKNYKTNDTLYVSKDSIWLARGNRLTRFQKLEKVGKTDYLLRNKKLEVKKYYIYAG